MQASHLARRGLLRAPLIRSRVPTLVPALTRKVASIPAGNHLPKPPVEVYPLFAIVLVPLSFAAWISYEKLVNDPGVIVSKQRYESGYNSEFGAETQGNLNT
ncbi:SubName: Full=Uncharacterized protein {ECO:0000313/EMBL:CCA76002.1} [Serendipita indica DSM 11827]|uniref:Uncharacterized protein n=1 Tax=Serendipita indica (strain DSM 11827) TaxID=1109443 RepID=G4TXF9_SERID|nr:SubName: Full=Uncharacterized protein {ECO:0000313/EMBL:CCA76002.1} [Serendipita indica DSM 11827]CCA76002.1 hypothetical protein PIIN_10002 [Serendipita indica DSM 11827]